ncbi:hypothetical protein SmJEL517_g00468 [Synchytrium microbalum]|uniref:Uncharacterized protein n=1 Tax=Synchytrium microbalum TaxID=1806994 RepID=A0A507CHB6_9FUNG|nr:uncharacterized protein SmJEL517_g00468 [Synchytrium microbalum]TPX37414.1 hypothetical protein SmJEL517_g00468 [Synchytrium microbalum]
MTVETPIHGTKPTPSGSLPVHSEGLPASRAEEITLGMLKATMANLQAEESRTYGSTLEGGAGSTAAQALSAYAAAVAQQHGVPTTEILQKVHKGVAADPADLAEKLAQEGQDMSAMGSDVSKGIALLIEKAAEKMREASALALHEFENEARS